MFEVKNNAPPDRSRERVDEAEEEKETVPEEARSLAPKKG